MDVARAYPVDPDCARRMARAVGSYRFHRPSFRLPVLVTVVVGVAVLVLGPWWLGLILVVLGLTLPLLLWVQTAALAGDLGQRGYPAGSVLRVRWDDDGLQVANELEQGRYPYSAVHDAAEFDGVVVLRMRLTRLLLALPAETVPAEARSRLPR